MKLSCNVLHPLEGMQGERERERREEEKEDMALL